MRLYLTFPGGCNELREGMRAVSAPKDGGIVRRSLWFTLLFVPAFALTATINSIAWSQGGIVISCGDEDPNCERLARRQAQQAERQRQDAVIQRRVDAEVAIVGEHRRSEVEARIRMQDAAANARGQAYAKKQSCSERSFPGTISARNSARERAEASLQRSIGMKSGCSITGSETLISMAAGSSSCVSQVIYEGPRPKVGKCLACITEQQAINLFGYVPGKGYPPPRTEWVCKAQVQCVAQKCASGPVTVAPQ